MFLTSQVLQNIRFAVNNVFQSCKYKNHWLKCQPKTAISAICSILRRLYSIILLGFMRLSFVVFFSAADVMDQSFAEL